MPTPGTQLMIKENSSKEKETSQDHQPVENQSKLVMSSFCCLVLTEAEELSSWNLSHQVISLSLAHMPSTEFLWRESIQLTSFPPQPKFHWQELTLTLMMPGSRDKEPGPKVNWRMLLNKDLKELKKASNQNKNGENKPNKSKNQSIQLYSPTSPKSSNSRAIWAPDSPFTTTASHTNWDFDLYLI